MINNSADDFGCLQNSLFIASCPHYFENILKLRTNRFSTAGGFMELKRSCYYSNYYTYYVKTGLSNIALSPDRKCPFRSYFCILLLTLINRRGQLTRVPVRQCPHKRTLLTHFLCVSLLSQLLFFATNLHCQLWLSEQLWVMRSANVWHMEKFRIILLSKNTTGCRKSHSVVMNSQRDKQVSKFTSYLTALQQIWVMDPTYSKLLYTARHFPTAWIYTLSMGFLMIAIFFFPIKSSWLHIKKLLVHFETCS